MQIAGSAGRPATSVVAVTISVAPSRAVIASQVHATRRPKRSAAARKSEKKRMSGGPRFAVASSPGTRNAIETFVEDLRLLLDHVLRRPAPDRDRVHPRDHHRDQRRPHHVLEPRQEPEAEADERKELREVVEDVELREVEQHRERREREPRRQHRRVVAERQQQPDERERRREEDER